MRNIYAFKSIKSGGKLTAAFLTLVLLILSASLAQAQQKEQLIDQNVVLINTSHSFQTSVESTLDRSINYRVLEDDGCSQTTPGGDEVENGLGNLAELEYANDFVVPSGHYALLNRVIFNVLINPGAEFDSVAVNIYEDSGAGPGTLMSELSIEPSSVDVIGDGFGFDLVEVSLDFEEAIELAGGSGETIYWVGVLLEEYTGSASYMEVTTNTNTPNVIYYTSDGENWLASDDPEAFDEEYDGIITFEADCIELEGCTGVPEAGEISNQEGMEVCANNSFSLAVSGTSQDAGLTFQWESKSPDAEDWAEIEGANNNNLIDLGVL